ncbi:MAG: DUF262 domain-containing protein [Deltaproteobacteria bacterium]|nr:DUF262 domain-containing protein [Deltaproteobacteria bacterium]
MPSAQDLSPTSMFRPLTRRPAATTITVRELIQKVQAGEVRVPQFQRPLRWKQGDVIDLVDSVWRGYPIGSLLFWKRSAPAEKVRIGSAWVDAPAVSDAWWVVDGQQRTIALAASLLEMDQAGDERWTVRFDPSKEAFLPGRPTLGREELELPVQILGDLRRLGRWLRENSLGDRLITVVEEAQQRILDYSIPAYVVETDDEQALRAVFARLNSSGARMRSDEVFQALLGAPTSAGSTSLDLDALQRGVDRDGFGLPPRFEILKSVLAMSGLDPTKQLKDLARPELESGVSREDADEALTRVVSFLREDCRIPHFSLIPYPVVFSILAKWFYLHPETEAETRTLLARWVWRGTVTGAHERAEVSAMRQQVRSITEDSARSLDRLLRRVGKRTLPQPWSLSRFVSSSARSRVEILALLDVGPQDQLGPVKVGELISGGRIAREILRSHIWRTADPDTLDLARTAANRALLGSQHTGVSVELTKWTWPADAPRLQSHLIDERAFELLRAQDVGGFLTRRADSVRACVERFVAERASWDEPDLRPLLSYRDEGA